MGVDLRGVPTVLLPGTGSDDDYVYRAFAPALHGVGAVPFRTPRPARLIAGYRAATMPRGTARSRSPACRWEPPWRPPGRSPTPAARWPSWPRYRPGRAHRTGAAAALAATYTAGELRRDGLVATTARMRESSPRWLADELTRSWLGQWPDLPEAMTEAAAFVAPTTVQLAGMTTPMGVAAASDDPVHPLEVGVEWVAAASNASLRTVTLDDIGADPGALGARGAPGGAG